MKTIASNYSFASCHDIKETINAMCADNLPKEFSLSHQKMRYLITEALAPYFFDQMVDDAQRSYYTISYDETCNIENRKELQILIRYWSEEQQEAVCRHLQTSFIGHADAETIKSKLILAIENAHLPFDKLLMIGCDGPNVNKKVLRLMNEEILTIRKKGLISIGTCSIHTIHNAFLKGLTQLGGDGGDLIIATHSFFDGWPSRWDEYIEIQEKLNLPCNKFMKYSSTRWLTFGPAAKRLIEQWEGLILYFLKHIPQKNSSLMYSVSYKIISKLLKCSTIKAELYLGISSAELFTKFTGHFQCNDPLIHKLYSELFTLVRRKFSVMKRRKQEKCRNCSMS
ncbi:uncharacterized protein [Centruroides vittatus]|uniref:uncharacterized protein n=1 Tax=Centruroides vittatus TaxID=120091 RepID=UPI003510404D